MTEVQMNIQVFNPRQVADQSEEMAFTPLATFGAGGAGGAGVFWSLHSQSTDTKLET